MVPQLIVFSVTQQLVDLTKLSVENQALSMFYL